MNNNQGEAEESDARELEKIEEEKLKAKYPSGMRGPVHSAFLQKRLQKNQKFFDSGDYQMAKQKSNSTKPIFANKANAGDSYSNDETRQAHPTPETVPVRKSSIIQPACNKYSAS